MSPSETSIPFLPDRLNGEPVVCRGLTSTELAIVTASAIGFWLPICLLVLGYAGYFMMGFGVVAMLAVGTVWSTSAWIQAMKRGRPAGYHLLRLELLLHDLRLRRSHFIDGAFILALLTYFVR